MMPVRPVNQVLGALRLRGRLEDVAEARMFVTDRLRRHTLRETAVLLASELVANGIVHGSGDIVLVVLETPDGVRVEVTDAGSTTMPLMRAPDADAENGRGLLLVDCLAARWDHERGPAGLTAWFELRSDC